MAGFHRGQWHRDQTTLFPDRLEDWIGEDHPVRVVDLFVDELDLAALGFERMRRRRPGGRAIIRRSLLKLFIYGYLNRIPSSRRLEREAGRNVELMWLTGRLVPDHKTIADFRRDNGPAIRRPARSSSSSAVGSGAAGRLRRDGRQQVQGGEQPRPELHEGQDRQPPGTSGKGGRAATSRRWTAPTGRKPARRGRRRSRI